MRDIPTARPGRPVIRGGVWLVFSGTTRKSNDLVLAGGSRNDQSMPLPWQTIRPHQQSGKSRMGITCDELRKFGVFRNLAEQQSTQLVERMTGCGFAAGARILEEGESVQSLWVIRSGRCRVTRTAKDGTAHMLAELSDGDVFGEMSFLRDAPHSANIDALTDVEACCLRREEFDALATESPTIGYLVATNIAAVLSERLRRMDNWVCDHLGTPEVNGRNDEWQQFRSAVYTNWEF